MSADDLIGKPLIHFLKHWALVRPNAIAVQFNETHITYGWLATTTALLSKHLQSLGITKGAIVLPILTDRVLELLVTMAIESLGAVRVAQMDSELIEDKCDFVVTDLDMYQGAKQTIYVNMAVLNSLLSVVHAPDLLDKLDYLPDPSDICFISCTSGTTGEKKYFAETYSSSWEESRLMRSLYFTNGEDSFISLYPLRVGAGYKGFCLAIITGGTIVLDSINSMMMRTIHERTCHVAMIVKDASYLMSNYSGMVFGNKISTLRVLGGGLPDPLRRWLKENVAHEVFNSYSSNEASQIGEVLESGMTRLYDGVSVKIVNDDWSELELGAHGQIAIKSKQVITRYLWNHELNLQRFSDGWYLTDDIGYILNSEQIVLVDRADDMLVLEGVKVPPKPIEREIMNINGVVDVAVISLSTPKALSMVAACISIDRSCNTAKAFERISMILRNHLYGACEYLVVVFEQLPRTDSGKVIKLQLRNTIQALLHGAADSTKAV